MKQEDIIKMFDSIAPSYDLVNRVLTFGIDKKWREKAVKKSLEYVRGDKVHLLDVACGSGDMIEAFLKEKADIEVCGLDASAKMLEIAKKRFQNATFYESYATEIPCEGENFDILSISFGLRNILEIDKALEEFYRVLKKEGIFVILEFTKPEKKSIFREIVDIYSDKILPKIGGAISKNEEAYRYLPESINRFLTQKELIKKVEEKKFKLLYKEAFNFSQVSLLIFKKLS